MSEEKSLEELKSLREWAAESGDADYMKELSKQIKEREAQKSKSESTSAPEGSSEGVKEGMSSIRHISYGPDPYTRDHDFTVGDLFGLKQGEVPKKKKEE